MATRMAARSDDAEEEKAVIDGAWGELVWGYPLYVESFTLA